MTARAFALAAALLLALPAAAAEFSVAPMRLDLPRGARSGAVAVGNEADKPLRMQMRLMEWTQDAEGKDVYKESDELVYYPRMMTVAPGEKRMVRVGLKTAAPAGAPERTYRLYIDELPGGEKAASSGINFTIRFALPVFIPPSQPESRGAIESVSLREGRLTVVVANPGNQSFRISTVGVSGGAFAAESAGWYLLAGATRAYRFDIPPAACRALKRIEVAVKADRLSFGGGLDVDAGMCAP
jgi:fimbrial chaperone protein